MHSVALAWDKSEQMKAYVSFLNCADSLKDLQNARAIAKVHYHYILHCKRAKANQSFSATADWAPFPRFFFPCRFCYWNVQFALALYTVIGRTSRKFSKLSFYIPFHRHGGSIAPLTSKTLLCHWQSTWLSRHSLSASSRFGVLFLVEQVGRSQRRCNSKLGRSQRLQSKVDTFWADPSTSAWYGFSRGF